MRYTLSIARKVIIGMSLIGVSVTTVPALMAQQNNAVRGGLAGIVTDAGGAVVPGATVKLSGPQGDLVLKADSTGRYSATGLTPGIYTLTVTASGFETYVSKGNEVTIDHTGTLNAKLAVGKQDVTVEVDGGVTTIDVENTSVNTAVTDTVYNALPLPRNVSGAFYIAPGVTSGGGTGVSNPSIGGSSGLENLYTADGVTITDQNYGGLGTYTLNFGSLGSGINLAFVKEVDIKTGAFEPKYGQSDGGIVEIVTKSGTDQYHGAVTAYVAPEWASASRLQEYQFGFVVTTPSSQLSSPQYEGSFEIGGYVPKLRDKLFFFGAFDPALNRNLNAANPNSLLGKAGYQPTEYSTTSLSWAGKLTYAPMVNTIIEASSYGDPSRRNSAPLTLSARNAADVSSSYGYGSRNSILRVNTTIRPWLTAFGAYSYNFDKFHENPSFDHYFVQDRTATPYVSYGYGLYNPNVKTFNWQLQGEMEAHFKFFGQHTASVGYLFDHDNFEHVQTYSGPAFAIPNTNAAGTSLAGLYSTSAPLLASIGKATNAEFRMYTAGPGCTYCATYKGAQVYLQQFRGQYAGTNVNASSRYKAAYGNEVYEPNKYVVVNLGLRWEQQAYGGSLLTYYWRDNWSPRLGLTVDPFGDRKSKAFFTYSRYQIPLPLDAAVRQLGNEQDDSFFFAPQKDSAGNAIIDPVTGSVAPNLTSVLNGTPSSTTATFSKPTFASSTGEGILPGTKMEYTDEYILGVQREVKPGMVLSIRYSDRQLHRIVEDIGTYSQEGNYVPDGEGGGGGIYGITNPNSKTDLIVNEHWVTYTDAQFKQANGVNATPGAATSANYKAPVAGCTFGNDVDTSGGHGGYFLHWNNSLAPTDPSTFFPGGCLINDAVSNTPTPDGSPDGFADGRRHYQALEFELNRALRNHWQARLNYRYAKLWGNYEGFFRNDNGQSDPGISSQFDFINGGIGLNEDIYTRSYLNTDRRSTANMLVAYTVDKSSPYVSRLNGVTVGAWFHVLSGNPISKYDYNVPYASAGEFPVGPRGSGGRYPVATQLDLHIEDAVKVAGKYTLRGGFDGFNVLDSQPLINQNQQLSVAEGTYNADYGKPTQWQQSFRARFKLAFEF